MLLISLYTLVINEVYYYKKVLGGSSALHENNGARQSERTS